MSEMGRTGGKTTTCPSVPVILRAIDGKLPRRMAAEVAAHIAHCPSCEFWRDELADLQVQCAPYRIRWWLRSWLWLQRTLRTPVQRVRPSRRWLIPVAALVPVIATVIVIAVGVVFFVKASQAVVHADELLTRAAEVETTQPAGRIQRILLRLTPEGASASSSTSASASASGSASRKQPVEWPFETGQEIAEPSSATLIGAIVSVPSFDWRSPLAVRRFHTWRAALPSKHDTITDVGPVRVLRTTTTASGTIVEGELAVAREDYHVVRVSWVIAGLGRLDIEEVDAWIRPPTPTRLRASTLDRDTRERTELAARVALRATDLDLAPIHVYQVETGVQIDGTVPSSTAQRALATRLATVPQVTLTLRVAPTSEPGRLGARCVLNVLGEMNETNAMDTGHAALVPEIVRRAPRIAQRLNALGTLADRYPQDMAARLPNDAQAMLRRLVDAHFTGLRSDLTALDEQLATFIGSASRPILPSQCPRDWRTRAPRALTEAQTLTALLTTPTSTSAAPAAAEVRVHLDALWRHLSPAKP